MYDNARGYAGSTYIAIGYQLQWGFTLFEPVDYKNINFTLPLAVNGTFCAFSTGYDAKGSTFLWHSMSHFNNINVGVTGFVFDSRYTFTGLGYLAICWQKQWGYIESLSGTRDLNLPLAYVNRHLCVVATGGNTKGYGAIRAQTISLTQVRLYAYTPEDGAYSHYLSLGYQLQWGYVKSTKVTFPIQFNIIYTVLGNAHGSNNSNNDHYFLGSFSTTEASFYYSNMNFTGLSWIAIGSA